MFKMILFVLACISVVCADGLSPRELSEVIASADCIGEVRILVFEGDTTFSVTPGGEYKGQNEEYLIAGKIGWMYKGEKKRRNAIFRHSVQTIKGFWLATDASGIESMLEEGKKYIFFWNDRGDGRMMLLRAEEITSRTKIMVLMTGKNDD